VLDRIFGRIKTEPQISRPILLGLGGENDADEKNRNSNERTIGKANRRTSPSTCSRAIRGLLVAAASAATSAGSL